MLRRTTGYGFTPGSGRFKTARVAVLGSFRGVWGYKNTNLGPCLLHFTEHFINALGCVSRWLGMDQENTLHLPNKGQIQCLESVLEYR